MRKGVSVYERKTQLAAWRYLWCFASAVGHVFDIEKGASQVIQ